MAPESAKPPTSPQTNPT